MAIYPQTETRRAKRRNGAAYKHRRLRSLTGGHSVITHGRRMECQRSHSMFLTHGIAGTVGTSWSDRALLPRKRARNAISHRSKKAKQDGGLVRNRTRVKPLHWSFVRLLSHPKQKPTSAPTSTRDEPHVGTHICARPLRIHYSEVLERTHKVAQICAICGTNLCHLCHFCATLCHFVPWLVLRPNGRRLKRPLQRLVAMLALACSGCIRAFVRFAGRFLASESHPARRATPMPSA